MPRPKSEFSDLLGLFYDDPGLCGELLSVESDLVPSEYRRLLAHNEHMTVAMEAHVAQAVGEVAEQPSTNADRWLDAQPVQLGKLKRLWTLHVSRSVSPCPVSASVPSGTNGVFARF